MINYILYKLSEFTGSKKEHPEYTANILFSLLISFTLFATIIISQKLEFKLFDSFFANKSYALIIFSISFVIGYFVFIREERYKVFLEKYDKERKSRKIFKIILLIFYILTIITVSLIM